MTDPLKPSDMPETIYAVNVLTNGTCIELVEFSHRFATKYTRADLVEQAANAKWKLTSEEQRKSDGRKDFECYNENGTKLCCRCGKKMLTSKSQFVCDFCWSFRAQDTKSPEPATVGDDPDTWKVICRSRTGEVLYYFDSFSDAQHFIATNAPNSGALIVPLYIRAATAAKSCDNQHLIDLAERTAKTNTELRAKCDKLVQALEKFMQQIEMCNFIDDDHDIKMNLHYLKTKEALAEHRTTKDKK